MMKTNKTTLAVMIASCFGAGLAMAEETQEAGKVLSPVVVTATRVEQDAFDLPVAIDKVERKDIEGKLQMTLSESLVRVPGITAQSRNQMAQDPQISSRGFGARSSFGVRGIRIYIDGIPLTMPDGIGNPGSVDLTAVDGIEVMRGPFSAMYGNSSGGVIQLLSAKAPTSPEVSADVLMGSFGTRRETVQAAGTIGKTEYTLNYSDFDSDGFRKQSASQKRQATAKLGVQLSEDSKLTTLINWFDQFAQDPGGLNKTEANATPTIASPNNMPTVANARVLRDNTQVGFNFEKRIDGNNTINIVTYAGHRNNLQYLYSASPTTVTINGTATAVNGRASSISRDFFGAEARGTNKGDLMGKAYQLTYGLNFGSMDDLRQDKYAYLGEIRTNAALRINQDQKTSNFDQFAQGTLALNDKWDWHAGVRHTTLNMRIVDRIGSGSGSLEFNKTNPVTGLVFKATPTLNFYANVGQGFETPTMAEVSYTNSTSGGTPNFALKPSTSTNIEVGSKWMVSDTTFLNAAAFDIKTENEIVINGGGTYVTYNNAGKTRRNGLELSSGTTLPGNVSLFASYTYLDAQFASSYQTNAGATSLNVYNSGTVAVGNTIPGTYKTQIFAEAAWKYQPLKFEAAVDGRYNSKVYINDLNKDFAPSSTVFGVRASLVQELGKWRLTEYVRVDNLSDKKYIGSIRVNDTNQRYYETAAGRNWIAGIKANYAF